MKKTIAILVSLFMLFGMCSCDFSGKDSSLQSESSSEAETEEVRVLLKSKRFVLFLEDAETTSQIVASVYENGNAVENAEITYIVTDPSIAEVNADGTIIAKSVGSTEVKVVYKGGSATAEVKVVGKVTERQVNTFEEKYVNIYGRVYEKDEKLCLDHVGAGVGVAIDGTSLTAEIEVDSIVYLCVYVDGAEEYTRIKLMPSQKEYTLAEDLEAGFHTVRIVKSSEIFDGQIRLVWLTSQGFYAVPEKSALRIEFIGDSITAGYGALGSPGDARTVENSDACSSYAYYAAQKLNADYSMIAIQGICVAANMWRTETMKDVYKLVSPHNPVEYDFSYEPDVVVLNLGTNDGGYITQNFDYSEQFPTDYREFLQYIRAKNPNAYILCLYGFMGKQSSVDKGIDKAIEDMHDDKVMRLKDGFIQNTLGANGHPAQEAQKEWGLTLAEYIDGIVR